MSELAVSPTNSALDSIRISGRNDGHASGGGGEGAARAPDTRSDRLASYRKRVIPRHVQHCHKSGARDWWIYTWDKAQPANVTRIPYSCNSWRCPHCRRHEGAITFARIRAAFEHIEDFDPSRVFFGVLTIDRNGYHSGESWGEDPLLAYRAISPMLRKLLKRVNRRCKKNGWEPVGSRWAATVEAHKTGWPHLQLMMYVPKEWSEELREWDEEKLQLPRGERTLLPIEHWCSGWFGDAACEVGWGRRGTVEIARSLDAVSGYLTKTAGKHDAAVGEVAKLTQLPLNAPVRFRRVRAGKGFLPPRSKGTKTGTLVRRRFCQDGTPQVEPLHDIKDPDAVAVAVQCCYEEESLWRAEAEGRNVAAVLAIGVVAQPVDPDCHLPPIHRKPRQARAPPMLRLVLGGVLD